jgi:hypothetical protein
MTDVMWFDSSFDELTEQELDCLATHNYRVYEGCGWTGNQAPGVRVINLRRADGRGYLLTLYCSLPDNATVGAYHMEQGLAGIPTDLLAKLKLVLVDIERPGIRASAIREAIEYLKTRGFRPAIYTSKNAWDNYVIFDEVNTSTSFTDVPLQNAFWDNNPDRDFARFPFGGWAIDQVWSEQYTGDTPDCGQELDHSVWNIEKLTGKEPTPMPAPVTTPPTAQQKAAAAGYLLGIAVKWANGQDITDADKALLRFFGG